MRIVINKELEKSLRTMEIVVDNIIIGISIEADYEHLRGVRVALWPHERRLSNDVYLHDSGGDPMAECTASQTDAKERLDPVEFS